MSDDDTLDNSGNRWERQPDDTAPVETTTDVAPVEAAPSPPRRRGLGRPRALAGSAAALVALAGVGGFGIGRATAGDTVMPASADVGVRQGTTGDRDGIGPFDGDGGGRGARGVPPGQTAPGQTAPDQSAPGQPGQDQTTPPTSDGTSGDSSTT